MSFVARELDRISTRLRESEVPSREYERLYAAQQALSWALEPTGFKSPYDAIMDFMFPLGEAPCTKCVEPSEVKDE